MPYFDSILMKLMIFESLGDTNFVNFYNDFSYEVDEMIYGSNILYVMQDIVDSYVEA